MTYPRPGLASPPRILLSTVAAMALVLVLLVTGAVGTGSVTTPAAAADTVMDAGIEPAPDVEPGAEPDEEAEPVPEPAPEPPTETVTVPAAPDAEVGARSNDIWIPGWVLLLIAGVAVFAAVMVATQSYLRFTQTRKSLEG